MAVSVRGWISSTYTDFATNIGWTMPAGIQDGDVAQVVLTVNTETATPIPVPSGWTAEGTLNNNNNVAYSRRFSRVCTAADSGTTVAITLPNTTRRAVGGFVAGPATVDATVFAADATLNTTMDIPGITPTDDDCLLIALVGGFNAAGQPAGVTAPAGWTEGLDVSSDTGSGAKIISWGGSKQLTGQGGVAQAATSATLAGTGRGNVWVFALAEAVVAPPSPEWWLIGAGGTLTGLYPTIV